MIALVIIAKQFQAMYEPELDPSNVSAPVYLVIVRAAVHRRGGVPHRATGDQSVIDAILVLLTPQLEVIIRTRSGDDPPKGALEP